MFVQVNGINFAIYGLSTQNIFCYVYKKRMRPLLWILLSCIYFPLKAQQLKPGFDAKEYFELMSLPERGDTATFNKRPPDNFSLVAISPLKSASTTSLPSGSAATGWGYPHPRHYPGKIELAGGIFMQR